MSAKDSMYSVGVDFGTLSARAVLLNVRTGEVVADAVCEYQNGVITELPKGPRLPDGYALQNPRDYLDALATALSELLAKTGVSPTEITGLGIDFTASTVLPVDKDGSPLCFLPEFEREPHAYVKLWKHHGATAEAERITALAKERGERFLARYGGKISSELFLPKVLETLHRAPAVYEAAAAFCEAGDWVTRVLVGKPVHTAAFAGFKALWDEKEGFPSKEYLSLLHPRLASLYEEKVIKPISPLGEVAGRLTEEGARLTGLSVGTAVALPMIDAQASLPALRVFKEGDMLLILGTSACHILNSQKRCEIDGIFGFMQNGVFPSLYTYEAGQSCFGEHFSWFLENAVPKDYHEAAKKAGVSVFAHLNGLAARYKVGESALLALDWFGGNRSPLANDALSGAIIGYRPSTKPEEVYRALLEAVAFGTRRIVELFKDAGLSVSRIVAGGGIAEKNPLLMQILADVLDTEITVPSIPFSSAVGAALGGAFASGASESLTEAARALQIQKTLCYSPTENAKDYNALYLHYRTLSGLFEEGRGLTLMQEMQKMRK